MKEALWRRDGGKIIKKLLFSSQLSGQVIRRKIIRHADAAMEKKVCSKS
jgi:hypothetical protein